MSGSRSEARRFSAIAAAILAATLLAGLLPPPVAVAGDPAPAGPDASAPGLVPSIAYEEAVAHEGDKIVFRPGGIVSVGFKPRSADRWPVDGRAPAALPGGRATGREMAASAQGSSWAGVTRSDAGPDGSDVVPGAAGDNRLPVGPLMLAAPASSPVDAPAAEVAAPASAVGYTAPVDDAVDLAAAAGLRRQVFGFLPYWELSGASTKLNYDVLSTIAYFSVGANGKGDLKKKSADGSTTTGWGGWTSSNMTSVINAAHQRGTRVVLTVSAFAWTSSQAAVQRSILGSSAARRNLARQVAAAVRDRGADGVNLDFEPLASGYADEFVLLLRAVRSELNKVKRGYQLTYDTTGYIGNYPLEASVKPGAADAIFVMGYDYRISGSGTAGSIDPLSGSTYDLADTVRSYTARVSPSRLILGLPWYGRAWSTKTDAARSTSQSGLKYGYSTAVNYESLTALVDKYGRRWDSAEQSPYIVYRRQNCTSTYGCVTSWRQVYYDDGQSMKLRLSMVNDYGLRGAGIWALGYDGGHPELYRAFAEAFLPDKSAPQAGIRLLGPAQPDEGFVVAWGAEEAGEVVSYDVQVSANGGAWKTWLTATRATSNVWLGKDGVGYAFRVRARDGRGNSGAWNVTSRWDGTPSLATGGFGIVKTNGLAYRTGPRSSAAKLGSLAAATVVAITRGPVVSGGYAWYEVTQPVKEWNPVSFVERGVWIAARSPSGTHVTAHRAPNSTRVQAGLVGLDFGAGKSLLGASGPAIAGRSLSPNGDGSRDSIRLRWTSTRTMDKLTLKVHRADGSLAGTVAVPARASGARAWSWNGRIGGSRVPDGRYVLQLVGTASGKTYSAPSARPVTGAQVATYAVTVDTVAPEVVSMSASSTVLSPNGDGTTDLVKLTLRGRGATRWTARVTNAAGSTVRTADGTGATAALTWSGTSAAGKRVADGHYTVRLSLFDSVGNPASRSFPVTVDTTGPVLAVRVSPATFSPDGDGATDAAALAWSSNEEASGTVRIYKGATRIRSWTFRATTDWSTTWDGRTAAGKAVADGRYTVKVSTRDAVGNTRVTSRGVVVDRTVRSLRWSGGFFPQDADTLRPRAELTWRSTRSGRTTLRLYDAGGNLVRTAWIRKSQAAGSHSWTWDGRLANGSWAPQGRYMARLTLTSSVGKQMLDRPVWAAGFSVSPSPATVVPGQALRIRFATLEPLSTRPTVVFSQPGRTAVKVTATRRADGTYRATFKVAAGAAGTGNVRIRAKDSGGGTNTTTIPIRIGSR